MSLPQIKVNGRKVWQARVAVQGLRKSTIRPSKQEARDAEAELLGELKELAGQAEREGQAPATLRDLFDFYVLDLENRGKGHESIVRAEQTKPVMERLMPELLARPVSRITDFQEGPRKRLQGCAPAARTGGGAPEGRQAGQGRGHRAPGRSRPA